MANIFQNILSPDNYLYWFPPNEDKNDESVIYIHFNLPNSTSSFILNKQNTTRYNLIKLFEKIHDETGVTQELTDDIKRFFVIKNKQEFSTLIKSLKLFEKEQIVFLGETELQIDNCKVDNLWVTNLYKTTLSTLPNCTNINEDTFSEDNYNVNDYNSDNNSNNNSDNNSDNDSDNDENLLHIAVINYNESNPF
tara:strand:+ start:207 stop:788 length:582 start_codon:yes stop_codon:yes gene_type:complete